MSYLICNYEKGENSWDDFFFDICQVISSKSKDNSTKVGAVIVNSGHSIISTGFNGFPIGVDDTISSRYDRPEKYLWTCHAEENAIAFAARNGISTNDATLYSNRMPSCSRCSRLALQAGIRTFKVLCDVDQSTLERWSEENKIVIQMVKEANASMTIFMNSKIM